MMSPCKACQIHEPNYQSQYKRTDPVGSEDQP
jgi:hypothetical protein